jgi:hypothetical protein
MIVLAWAPTEQAHLWSHLEGHVIFLHFKDINALIDVSQKVQPSN